MSPSDMPAVEVPTTTVADLPEPIPGGLTVLDVREDHEWIAGHIAGAVHIPLNALPERVKELDPKASTLVVCHIGGRSAAATWWLQAHGHAATNLAGGMDAWEAAGRPIVTSEESSPKKADGAT